MAQGVELPAEDPLSKKESTMIPAFERWWSWKLGEDIPDLCTAVSQPKQVSVVDRLDTLTTFGWLTDRLTRYVADLLEWLAGWRLA